jgi:hypothetical protein
MRSGAIICTWVLVAAACGQKKALNTDSTKTADATPAGDDPCRYLAASEVEPYTGPLVAPPYRAGSENSVPDRKGDGCLYRGTSGRNVVVQYSAAGGAMAGTVARRVPAVMDRLLHNGAGGINSAGQPEQQQGPGAAIMGSAGPGPWDNSNWFPTGTLIVFKGDASFVVDNSAADGGKSGAIDLATKALARLAQPLDYNGAAAVALAPKPVPPVPPCTLIPRAKAEAILGTLSADPAVDPDGDGCVYTVSGDDGQVEYPVKLTWTQGYKELATMKHSMSMVAGLMGPASKSFNVGAGPKIQMPAGGAMPDIPKLDPAQQKMMSGFFKAVGVPGAGGAISRGLKTDTTLAGPWDSAAMINGMWLLASKNDVGVLIDLGKGADYDKAKALLAAACERL